MASKIKEERLISTKRIMDRIKLEQDTRIVVTQVIHDFADELLVMSYTDMDDEYMKKLKKLSYKTLTNLKKISKG